MLILPLLASFVLCPPAAQGQAIAFQGERPTVKDGVAYLSSETCAILFDADSVWSPKRKEVSFTCDGHKVVMHVGDATMSVDGRTIDLPGKPYVNGEDAMVPVEAVAKGLNVTLCITIRSGETKTATLAAPGQTVEIRTFSAPKVLSAPSNQDSPLPED